MATIKILPSHEAQKIAAGEVVDRPANIVKELLENALDAGSTHITIIIKDGGKKLIRIEDNGHGMSPDDAEKSILRHSTSKITTIEDLETIKTFGFRGEALASITAVSKTLIMSKTIQDLEGIKLTLEAGTIIKKEPCAHAGGTTIAIEDLFYNVPARKKFLRATNTETRAISQLIQAVALSYPQVYIKFYNEENLYYNCGPVEKTSDRMRQLSSTLKKNDLLEIPEIKEHDIAISGFASHHHIARYDRNNIFFFVNGRAIKQYKLTNAFIKGYQNALPPQKYPIGALFITLAQQDVDVNIHPRKEEVAFLHPRKVEMLITKAVKNTLESEVKKLHINSNEASPINHSFQPFTFNNSPENHTSQNFINRPTIKALDQPEVDAPPFISPETFNTTPELSTKLTNVLNSEKTQKNPVQTHEKEQTITINSQRNYKLIGQLLKTYILIENKSGLTMIDGHAAHERVLYERFGSKLEKKEPVGLLFPEIIELSSEDIHQLESHYELLKNYGLIAETFGQQKIMISATPAGLQHIDYKTFLISIIKWNNEDKELNPESIQKKLSHNIQAMMACKAAVKAGDELTHEKMYEIIDQLMKTPNMLTCPHGRPTTWPIESSDIEKKFKRRL